MGSTESSPDTCCLANLYGARHMPVAYDGREPVGQAPETRLASPLAKVAEQEFRGREQTSSFMYTSRRAALSLPPTPQSVLADAVACGPIVAETWVPRSASLLEHPQPCFYVLLNCMAFSPSF